MSKLDGTFVYELADDPYADGNHPDRPGQHRRAADIVIERLKTKAEAKTYVATPGLAKKQKPAEVKFAI